MILFRANEEDEGGEKNSYSLAVEHFYSKTCPATVQEHAGDEVHYRLLSFRGNIAAAMFVCDCAEEILFTEIRWIDEACLPSEFKNSLDIPEGLETLRRFTPHLVIRRGAFYL